MASKLTPFQENQKKSLNIQCIRNDSKVRMVLQLHCIEWTWNCPDVQEPDFGKLLIEYTPNEQIAETKSLKHYLQRYRYRNAFAEELASRILLDFLYFVKPYSVEVTLAQNSRGGIANNVKVSWTFENDADCRMWKELNYTPKQDFRGGWPMLGTTKT